MATDATGTPTSPDSIPTYNTPVDAPSGKGFNAAMAAIQTALSARVGKPVGLVSGETAIWNGSAFVRSSVTGLTPSGIAGYPTDANTALRGNGTWAGGVFPYASGAQTSPAINGAANNVPAPASQIPYPAEMIGPGKVFTQFRWLITIQMSTPNGVTLWNVSLGVARTGIDATQALFPSGTIIIPNAAGGTNLDTGWLTIGTPAASPNTPAVGYPQYIFNAVTGIPSGVTLNYALLLR